MASTGSTVSFFIVLDLIRRSRKGPLTAPSFTLYRSRTESGGARYEALATFALG